jgi:hypothetical protein
VPRNRGERLLAGADYLLILYFLILPCFKDILSSEVYLRSFLLLSLYPIKSALSIGHKKFYDLLRRYD